LRRAERIDEAAAPGRAAKPDPKLIKLIARASLFQNKLAESSSGHLADVARGKRMTSSYFIRVLRLSYLAPDITRARVRAASRIGAKGETGIELPCAAGPLRPQSTTSRSGRLPSSGRLAKLCDADASRHGGTCRIHHL
jgi:hypothetical protein